MKHSSVFILLAALVAALAPGCREKTAAPERSPASATEWFQDVTDKLGVNFLHVAGTNYFMPDQVGSGVALFDYDGDGRLDIYFVQNGGTNSAATNQLFQQQPDGTFRDVSRGSGLDLAARGMGVVAGDVNNDGRQDVVITEYGATRLFLNTDGKFREITAEAGIDNARWAAPASFIDYDRDGWLDLVVGNYVDYDPTHVCADVHGRQDFCAPSAFGATSAHLWRNVTRTPGQVPKFEDRTETSGIFRARGAALGLVCADFNGDAWPDIFVADDGRPNRLFINKQNGTFTEEAAARGLAFNAMGATAANMGTAFADIDGNGMADLFITHLTEEFHSLFKQGPRGVFTDSIAPAGLQQQGWRGTGFGTAFVDFNHDGWLDLIFANGMVRRFTPGQTPVAAGVNAWWARYAQKAQLFANDGTGKFRDVSTANPALSGIALVGRSVAIGDLDRDGALDVVLASIAGPVRILRNVAPNRGHWITLKLVLPQQGGRDAIGAEVVVRTGAQSRWAVLQPATSYLANNEPVVHFGLGSAATIDAVEVLWPDGTKETFTGVAANRFITLRKGESR